MRGQGNADNWLNMFVLVYSLGVAGNLETGSETSLWIKEWTNISYKLQRNCNQPGKFRCLVMALIRCMPRIGGPRASVQEVSWNTLPPSFHNLNDETKLLELTCKSKRRPCKRDSVQPIDRADQSEIKSHLLVHAVDPDETKWSFWQSSPTEQLWLQTS